MKLVGVRQGRRVFVAVQIEEAVSVIADVDDFYGNLARHLPRAREVTAGDRPLASVELAPPVPLAARVICIGLNYHAHAAEGRFQIPDHSTIFGR